MSSGPSIGNIVGPRERLHRVRAWHARDLPWRQKQVIAALELGYTLEETAVLMDRSLPTVRRHVAEAEHRIFDVHDVIPHHGLLAKWCREHYDCCMHPYNELIANDQLFDTK